VSEKKKKQTWKTVFSAGLCNANAKQETCIVNWNAIAHRERRQRARDKACSPQPRGNAVLVVCGAWVLRYWYSFLWFQKLHTSKNMPSSRTPPPGRRR
jgi:hypothetical protein